MEFNSLPLDVHLAIFSYLSVREVMRIRQVCKQWNRQINDEFKIKRLQCCQAGHPLVSTNEFDFYFASIRCFLRYVSGNPKFNVCIVKWLKVQFDFSQLEDAFNLVNLFKSLVELRCWFSSSEDFTMDPEARLQAGLETAEKRRFVVTLNRVKKADFLMVSDARSYAIVSKVSVLLKTPSLMHLRVEPWEAFTVGYPEKLENLITPQLSLAPLDYSKFTSLRRIYTEIATQSSHVRSISASLTERLPSLREMHLEDYLDDYRDFEARYQALDKSPNAPGKAPAKIFYFGFEISSKELNADDEELPDSLNTFDPDSAHISAQFIAKNLHRSVDRNTCVNVVNYDAMAGELDDSVMFGLMLQKLSKISQLLIDRAVADEERLLRFIDKFKVLFIEFQNASLSQRFFEKLPAIGQRICWLNFETEPTMSILDGDFDFIFKLPNLDTLQFQDCQLPLRFVARLLREMERLVHIYFRQPGFIFSLRGCRWKKELNLGDELGRWLRCKILSKEAPAFVDELIDRLKVDGFACPKKMLALFRHLELEKQNHRFWMRRYIYDHTHSICLSEEQMQL